MVVISHFMPYPALFPLKWLICIPNISAVRGNVVFETLHDFYRTAIIRFLVILIFLGVSYLTIRAVSEDLHECIFALSRQNYDQVNAGYT